VPNDGGGRRLVQLVRELDENQIAIEDIGLRRPTLDDVFLTLTGHAAMAEDGDEAEGEHATVARDPQGAE
jgi:ABC-2 type transport system ATP-binding protein